MISGKGACLSLAIALAGASPSLAADLGDLRPSAVTRIQTVDRVGIQCYTILTYYRDRFEKAGNETAVARLNRALERVGNPVRGVPIETYAEIVEPLVPFMIHGESEEIIDFMNACAARSPR